VSFARDDAVVVLSAAGGRAVIRRRNGRFSYEATQGDPLKLAPLLAGLKADEHGAYDADALLAATVDHEYPAPLQRLWRAHFALVENPPDVIASLANRWHSGASSFGGAVDMASTHGGLNRTNSVTFILSTAGPLPPVLRSRDIPKALGALFGRPFPYRPGCVPKE